MEGRRQGALRRGARGVLLTAVAAAVSAGLVACGGDDGARVPGAGGGAGTTTGTTTGPRDVQEAQLAFARCMRARGVDIPDPAPSSDGRLRFAIPAGGGPQGPDARTREAFDACQGELAGATPDLDAGDRAALRDAQLAWARCMRERGVDVPDPEPGEGGRIVIRGQDAPGFADADRACRPIVDRAMERIAGEGS